MSQPVHQGIRYESSFFLLGEEKKTGSENTVAYASYFLATLTTDYYDE
jgi:hypothetical protein